MTRTLNLYLKAGDHTRTTDLCRTCFNPAVITLTVYVMTDTDMATVGTVTVCGDCSTMQG